MKTIDSAYYNPMVPKPRTFSQTTPAKSISSMAGRDTVAAPRSGSKGPLSVPRSGCCGK